MSPEEFEKRVRKMREEGVKGFLVSGGFDRGGSLHLDKYLPVMRRLRRELEVVFNVHPGIQDRRTVEEMADTVDIVDFEFTFTEAEIREKGVNRSPEDYVRTLEDLMERGPKYVVPHVMVGIPGDDPTVAIREASSFHPYMLNILVMIPTKGTPSEKFFQPSVKDVMDAIKLSSSLNKTSLGCMRPYPMKRELDSQAVRYVDRIANPHPSLRKDMELYDACCSLPDELLDQFKAELR